FFPYTTLFRSFKCLGTGDLGEGDASSGKFYLDYCDQRFWLDRFKFQRRRFQIRRALGQVEHFHSNDFISFVIIENHTGRDFLRLNDLGIVQTQVKRVGFLVHVQSHNLPFILRSKNTLTTRFGSTVLFTVTRSTLPPNSGIRRKHRWTVASFGSGRVNSAASSVRSTHSIGISRSAMALSACLVS